MATQASLVSAIHRVACKLSYEIEAVTQMGAAFVAGVDYGVIEAKWIPTGSLGLPLFGRFSPYHVGLLVLMLIVSTSLAWSHLQWILEDRKKYTLFICMSALPFSLAIEDAAWFVTRWQPIAYDEWTMIKPGLGINVGFSWIPLWYFVVFAWSAVMLHFARKFADRGYQAFRLTASRSNVSTNLTRTHS